MAPVSHRIRSHTIVSNVLLSSFRKRSVCILLNGGQDGLSWQDNDKFGGDGNVSMSMDDDGNVNYELEGIMTKSQM
jgi:hypothetical protein